MTQQLARSIPSRSARATPARRPVVQKVPSLPRVPAFVASEERAIARRPSAEVAARPSHAFDTRAPLRATEQQGSRSLAQLRGYSRADLYAIAEIGHHYLLSGGTTLALTIFEGLAAVAPTEAYFALALGLTHDHLDQESLAFEWYARASTLDPGDARPEINMAELYIARRDFDRGCQLLERAVIKAKKRGEAALERKASALLVHVRRRAAA